MAKVTVDVLAQRKLDITEHMANLQKAKKMLIRKTSIDRVGPRYQTMLLKSLVALSDGYVKAAMTFMSNKGRVAHGSKTEIQWTTELQDWWLAVTPNDKAKLTTMPVTSLQKSAVSSATKFMREHDLFTWVWQQNEQHKLAPSTQAIVISALELDGCPVDPVIRKTKCNKTAYQTLRRYRRRWGVSNSRIIPKESLPADSKKRKASLRRQHRTAKAK